MRRKKTNKKTNLLGIGGKIPDSNEKVLEAKENMVLSRN